MEKEHADVGDVPTAPSVPQTPADIPEPKESHAAAQEHRPEPETTYEPYETALDYLAKTTSTEPSTKKPDVNQEKVKSGNKDEPASNPETSAAAVEDDDFPIKLTSSDFFDDFELSPMPERHFNLGVDLNDPNSKFLTNDMGFRTEDVDMTRLLAADHPLLDKFQKSLQEQLLKRVYSMRDEVTSLVEGCKMKRAGKEVIGAEAFETQQTATKQENHMTNCLLDLETMTASCEEVEFQLAKALEEFQYEKDANVDAEQEEIALRAELDAVDLLWKQMESWEGELEDELMMNQRSLDYSVKTKAQLRQEQKQLDVLIFTMMKEVWKLEGEGEILEMQIRVKEESREKLAEAVALANIDIEAAQTEHRCLLHGWQSVLININHRDKYFNAIQAEYTTIHETVSSHNCELIHIKKEIHREHIENERLMLIKDRLEYEMKNVTKALDTETAKRDEFLKQVTQCDRTLEENNKQRAVLRAEINAVKEEEAKLFYELEALNQAKYQLERDILTHLQSSVFNSDACRQMSNVLKDSKEENRRRRINIARVEGQISSIHAEYQSIRMEDAEIVKQLQEIKSTMKAEDAELAGVRRDFERSEKSLSKNILLYEQLKLQASGDAAQRMEMWPQEVKIRQLEASMTALIDKNKQSQSFWLREQAIVVELSEKRQAQMKEINLLKKQICVMDQKNLRINDTLENLGNLEDTLSRNINAFENKMNYYATGLYKKKNCKASLNISNEKIQMDLQNKLEDSEFESLRLKADIIEMEDDKMALSKELIEKNRIALCWEKKLMMVLDTRKQMYESQSESGELCQMRTEIHRMNVRYSQLRKAQDKLIHDLDNCVLRRDSIVTLAEARTRGHKGGTQQWRVNFNRRRDDLKNKLTQVDAEFDAMEKRITAKEWEIEKATEELKRHQQMLDALMEHRDETSKRLETTRVDRQLSLDILLYKQRKLKTYTELSRGRKPYICYKTQATAHVAYVNERALNNQLRTVVEDLQTDLPQHNNFLTKCHNSLVLPAIKL